MCMSLALLLNLIYCNKPSDSQGRRGQSDCLYITFKWKQHNKKIQHSECSKRLFSNVIFMYNKETRL